jgi:ketosteroid isomerase-like protein
MLGGAGPLWLGCVLSRARSAFLKTTLAHEGVMSRVLLVFTLFSATVGCAHSQAVQAAAGDSAQNGCSAAQERALRQIPERWKEGYNRGDAAKVARLYAEGSYYLTQHFITGIVRGRAAIQSYVQRGVDAKYHIDSIQIMAMGCSGDLAYTVGKYESTNAGQKAFGVNVVVLRKIAGRWLIVAHEAAVPDPATAVQHLDGQGER